MGVDKAECMEHFHRGALSLSLSLSLSLCVCCDANRLKHLAAPHLQKARLNAFSLLAYSPETL